MRWRWPLCAAAGVLAFALVGLGASAYAPAKYGLLTESVPPAALVAANGWLEVSMVLSVLLGTGLVACSWAYWQLAQKAANAGGRP